MLHYFMITVQHKDENYLDDMYETPYHTKTYDPETEMYIFKIKRTTTDKTSVNSESKLKYGSNLVSIEPLEKMYA